MTEEDNKTKRNKDKRN